MPRPQRVFLRRLHALRALFNNKPSAPVADPERGPHGPIDAAPTGGGGFPGSFAGAVFIDRSARRAEGTRAPSCAERQWAEGARASLIAPCGKKLLVVMGCCPLMAERKNNTR